MPPRELLPPPHPLLVLPLALVARIFSGAAWRSRLDFSADRDPLLHLRRLVDMDVCLGVDVAATVVEDETVVRDVDGRDKGVRSIY
jgi:hypothetical protein